MTNQSGDGQRGFSSQTAALERCGRVTSSCGGVSGIPSIPKLKGIEDFDGPVHIQATKRRSGCEGQIRPGRRRRNAPTTSPKICICGVPT
jgi:hypothetical protein